MLFSPNGLSATDKATAKGFYSQKASQYETEVNKGFLSIFRNRERNAILSLTENFSSGRTVIDIGCGAGFYTQKARSAGLDVTAVDISENMIERVKSVANRTFVADLDSLKINEKFDWVVCAGVLDFVANPDEAFAHLAQLVGPSGRLVILSPRRGLGGLYYAIEKRIEVGIKVNLYSLSWFREKAKLHGLEVAQVLFPLPTNMAIRFHRVSG